MKTFSQFVALKEGGALDVDLPSDSDNGEESILRAFAVAIKKHRGDVMQFLERLAKQNPDIQVELDKLNHKNQLMPHQPPKKKLRMGSAHGNDLEKDGDVVVPNSADSAHGEMPG